MSASLASKLGLHGLPLRTYISDGAISLESQVAVLNAASASAQTTLAAPGANMIGKFLIIYASNVDNACDVDFTDGSGARTITFTQVNDAAILIGLSSTMWMVVQAPLGANFAPAITQAFSTANATHAARTAEQLTDNSGGSEAPDGTIAEIADIALSTSDTYTDAAVNAAVNAVVDDCANAIEECADQINKLIADQIDTAQVLNSVIDALQAQGLLS